LFMTGSRVRALLGSKTGRWSTDREIDPRGWFVYDGLAGASPVGIKDSALVDQSRN